MNYHSMSDQELLHYLDLSSDDPLIRRLINVLAKTRGALIDDLEHAGMDSQSWTFGEDWNTFSPGQYIEELRNDVERAEDELRLAQHELMDLQDECHRLSTRTIMQLIEEVQQEKANSVSRANEAWTETNRVRKENDKLREQIDMWGAMNRV
jgi:DNA repair exonuclease SbcCD ATPase subunit